MRPPVDSQGPQKPGGCGGQTLKRLSTGDTVWVQWVDQSHRLSPLIKAAARAIGSVMVNGFRFDKENGPSAEKELRLRLLVTP